MSEEAKREMVPAAAALQGVRNELTRLQHVCAIAVNGSTARYVGDVDAELHKMMSKIDLLLYGQAQQIVSLSSTVQSLEAEITKVEAERDMALSSSSAAQANEEHANERNIELGKNWASAIERAETAENRAEWTTVAFASLTEAVLELAETEGKPSKAGLKRVLGKFGSTEALTS